MHNFSGITLCTGGSRGGARGARDPLTFKTKLKHPPPPPGPVPLSQCLDNRPPLSEGLDLSLLCTFLVFVSDRDDN